MTVHLISTFFFLKEFHLTLSPQAILTFRNLIVDLFIFKLCDGTSYIPMQKALVCVKMSLAIKLFYYMHKKEIPIFR